MGYCSSGGIAKNVAFPPVWANLPRSGRDDFRIAGLVGGSTVDCLCGAGARLDGDDNALFGEQGYVGKGCCVHTLANEALALWAVAHVHGICRQGASVEMFIN